LNKEIKTGTTTIGLIAKNAVVLAADMKASMGHLSYDEETQKIYKISKKLGLTIAGSVGDALTIVRFLRTQAKLFHIEREVEMTPKAAATLLSNVLNSNRFYPFMCQFILGGLNKKPTFFDLDPSGGLLERKKYAVTGSGTEIALSVLDNFFKDGLEVEDAIKVAIKAIEAAKRRDNYSGGFAVRVMVITDKGIEEKVVKDIKKYLN